MRLAIITSYLLINWFGASAQLLGKWPFTSNTNGVPGAYNTVSPAAFSPSISSAAFTSGVYYGEGGWPAGILSATDYLQFTLTPQPGYALNIMSVRMQMRRSTTGTGSGPTLWALRSSVDGFTSNLGGGILTTSISTVTVTPPAGFDLLASSVTFRIYGFQTIITTGGLNRFVFDDIEVNGSNIVLAANQYSLNLRMQANAVIADGEVNRVKTGDELSLERSVDGFAFARVAGIRMNADAEKFTYNFLDNLKNVRAPRVFYRLALQSGEQMRFRSAQRTMLLASPGLKVVAAGGQLHVSSGLRGACVIRVFDVDGKEVLLQRIPAFAGSFSTSWQRALNQVYHVVLSNGVSRESAAFVGR